MSTSLAVGVLEELEQLQQPQRYRPISILHSIAFCIIPHPSMDARTIYAEKKNAKYVRPATSLYFVFACDSMSQH